ncbi:hypothetical protein M5K25_028398 [Dendrobium thyrsiflorum]|uniref:Uncharacterized protein n=1 Tax=Dendrobium thyrsiflorum TaxID=117978 RepID=A0ABD0TTD6_DENTH
MDPSDIHDQALALCELKSLGWADLRDLAEVAHEREGGYLRRERAPFASSARLEGKVGEGARSTATEEEVGASDGEPKSNSQARAGEATQGEEGRRSRVEQQQGGVRLRQIQELDLEEARSGRSRRREALEASAMGGKGKVIAWNFSAMELSDREPTSSLSPNSSMLLSRLVLFHFLFSFTCNNSQKKVLSEAYASSQRGEARLKAGLIQDEAKREAEGHGQNSTRTARRETGPATNGNGTARRKSMGTGTARRRKEEAKKHPPPPQHPNQPEKGRQKAKRHGQNSTRTATRETGPASHGNGTARRKSTGTGIAMRLRSNTFITKRKECDHLNVLLFTSINTFVFFQLKQVESKIEDLERTKWLPTEFTL